MESGAEEPYELPCPEVWSKVQKQTCELIMRFIFHCQSSEEPQNDAVKHGVTAEQLQ